jgi:hypothetical protein
MSWRCSHLIKSHFLLTRIGAISACVERRGYYPSQCLARQGYQTAFFIEATRCRDSVVGIATGYRLDDRGIGVQVPVG